MKKVVAFILFMAFVLMFLLGCSKNTQPTAFVAPIEQQPDSTAYKPTVIEKTGMILFAVFVVHQVTKQKQE